MNNILHTLLNSIGASEPAYSLDKTLSLTGWGEYTSILAITKLGSKYMIFGDYGALASSTDMVNWTYSTSLLNNPNWPTNTDVKAIANDGSKIIGIALNNAAVSTDGGVTWTTLPALIAVCPLPTTINWNGSQWLVTGQSGKVATSPDGVTWTAQTGLSTTAWGAVSARSVVWTGSKYVIGGDSGKVATSPDGVTWTNVTTLAATTFGTSSVNTLCWNATRIVAGGNSGKIATSTDSGATWTYQSSLSSTTFSTATVSSIAWNGTTYVAVGSSSRIAISTDGATWTYRTAVAVNNSTTATLGVVVWLDGKFYAMGAPSMTKTVMVSSTDGTSWSNISSNLYNGWGKAPVTGINWNGSQWLVVGEEGNVATSPDGSNWTFRKGLITVGGWTNFDAYATQPLWTGSQYIIGGLNSACATSPDGVTWTNRPALAATVAGESFTFITNGSRIVGIGSGGNCATSDDGGVTWTNRPTLRALTGSILGAIWTGSVFLAAGTLGTLYTSPDGITWTALSSLTSSAWGAVSITCIATNGSTIVIGGPNTTQRIATSTDHGATWTVRSGALVTSGWGNTYPRAMVWDGVNFVGISELGRYVAWSKDGVVWQLQPTLLQVPSKTTGWSASPVIAAGGPGKFMAANASTRYWLLKQA